jgi:hypothetical protein
MLPSRHRHGSLSIHASFSGCSPGSKLRHVPFTVHREQTGVGMAGRGQGHGSGAGSERWVTPFLFRGADGRLPAIVLTSLLVGVVGGTWLLGPAGGGLGLLLGVLVSGVVSYRWGTRGDTVGARLAECRACGEATLRDTCPRCGAAIVRGGPGEGAGHRDTSADGADPTT